MPFVKCVWTATSVITNIHIFVLRSWKSPYLTAEIAQLLFILDTSPVILPTNKNTVCFTSCFLSCLSCEWTLRPRTRVFSHDLKKLFQQCDCHPRFAVSGHLVIHSRPICHHCALMVQSLYPVHTFFIAPAVCEASQPFIMSQSLAF